MVRLGADRSLLRLSLVFMRRRIPRQTGNGAVLVLSIALPVRLGELAVRVKFDRLRPQPFRSLTERQQPVCLRSKPVPRIADFGPPYTVERPSDAAVALAVVQITYEAGEF